MIFERRIIYMDFMKFNEIHLQLIFIEIHKNSDVCMMMGEKNMRNGRFFHGFHFRVNDAIS